MRTLTLVLLVMLTFCCAASAELVSEPGHAPYYTNLDEAMTAAAQKNQPIAIKFYTDWCSWCKVMDTVTLVEANNIAYFTNDMVMFKTNAEKDTLISRKYAVNVYPTVVLVDGKGNEIDRIVGYLPPTDFLQTVKDYRAGKGTLDDLLNQTKTNADRNLAFQIAEKYKYRGAETDAKKWYQTVITGNEKDSLAGESRMALAEMFRQKRDYDGALSAFRAMATDFAGTPFAENADIWIGLVLVKKGDTTAAVQQMESFLTKYPNSEEIGYVKKQIDKLKNPPAPADAKKS